MKKNIDRQLEAYSKITYRKDLRNLERDVNTRIYSNQSRRYAVENFVERWIGLPASISASVMVSTLVLGMFLGAQAQSEAVPVRHDLLGLDIFCPTNTKLPSSILVQKK